MNHSPYIIKNQKLRLNETREKVKERNMKQKKKWKTKELKKSKEN